MTVCIIYLIQIKKGWQDLRKGQHKTNIGRRKITGIGMVRKLKLKNVCSICFESIFEKKYSLKTSLAYLLSYFIFIFMKFLAVILHSYSSELNIWSRACCREVGEFWLLEIGASIMWILCEVLVIKYRTLGINSRYYHWLSNAHFFLTVQPKLRIVFALG